MDASFNTQSMALRNSGCFNGLKLYSRSTLVNQHIYIRVCVCCVRRYERAPAGALCWLARFDFCTRGLFTYEDYVYLVNGVGPNDPSD